MFREFDDVAPLFPPAPVQKLQPASVDLLVDIFSDGLTDHMDIAERIVKLLRGDAGRTIADMADILDTDRISVAFGLALLTNFAGAVFATFTVETGEEGYVMVVAPSVL